MAPKVTSSSNRSKRSTNKPVTGAKPSNRANRQSVSTARVTQSGGGRTGSARITNASQRTAGSTRVTSSARPALPPGRRGGALAVRSGGGGGSSRGMSAQAQDARRFQAMNQTASAKAGKAAEPKPRTPAPGTGNVLKAAQQFSKDKAAKDRQVNRGVAAFRAQMNQSMVGKAAALVGGAKALGPKAVAETVAPRPTAKGTVSAGGAQGPSMPKRLQQQGYAAQEKKAREKLAARKKAAGSSAATPNTAASFDDAFRDARRAKVSTFTWRGKKYTTKMK